MPLVKVWNDNVHPHKESFRGDLVTIPAKGFVEMEWEDAMQFKGQFTGMAPIKEEDDGRGGMGEPDSRFFKMIRVEYVDPRVIFKEDGLVNPVTGKKAATKAELEAALRELAASDPDRVVRDPDLDRSGKDDRIAKLEADLEAMKALIQGGSQKRPPGRPKKEANA